MKGIQKLCLFMLVGFALAACSSDPKDDDESGTPIGASSPDGQGYFEFVGHVVYNNFEGGFYGLTSGKEKYDPLKLPRRYQTDGMKVKVRARTRDWVSGRNWGRMIHVVEIQPCCNLPENDEDD